MPVLDPNLYTVAWIAPLEIEVQAARHMLDKVHPGGFPVGPGDDYLFHAGEIHGHNVVIATFAAGQRYGTNSATSLASHIKKFFPNLWFGLLVGIAAGLPNFSCSPPRDIRLGDVIVAYSPPGGDYPAIIPYGLGKQKEDSGFELLCNGYSVPQTERIVGSAIGKIKAEKRDTQVILGYYRSMPVTAMKFPDPGQQNDFLYVSGDGSPVPRQPRPDAERPRVWYGSIGSGDMLLKSSRDRDKIKDKYNVIGLEMEAAGVMNEIPVGNIRGVCDYGDERKNNDWQPYAAAMAAAFAKGVLAEIPPKPAGSGGIRSAFSQDDISCLRDLLVTDPDVERQRIEATKGGLLDDSFRWVLDDPEFRKWHSSSQSQLLWIKGDAGKGKTMLMIGIIRELIQQEAQSQSAQLIAYFLCQATDLKLNNATSILRSLIYMLIQQQPHLISYLRERYDTDPELLQSGNTFYSLSAIFERMIQDTTRVMTYLLIDALDECEIGLSALLKLIARTKYLSAAPVKWIVSSRNRNDIEQELEFGNTETKLSLELNSHHISDAVAALIDYRVSRLKALQHNGDLLEQVKEQLLRKSDGTFLWVALVVQEMRKCQRSAAMVELLGRAPQGLTPFYDRMLQQIQRFDGLDRESCIAVLSIATLAYRPLHLHELCCLAGLYKQRYGPGDLENTVGMCGSFLTVRDNYIYLIHQSAKDYLSSVKASAVIFPSGLSAIHRRIFHESLRSLSARLRRNMYGLSDPGISTSEIAAFRPQPDPLCDLRYSCAYWLDHFLESAGTVDATENKALSDFFRKHLLHWLEALGLVGEVRRGILALRKLVHQQQKESLSDTSPAVRAHKRNLWSILRGWRSFKFPASNQPAGNQQHKSDFKEFERFASSCGSIIQEAPLQAYGAALAFCPQASESKNLYWGERLGCLEHVSIMQEMWDPCTQVLQGHTNSVTGVAFSPDGQTIASASFDHTIRLWDSITGVERHILQGHTDSVHAVAFSPDGQIIASASADHTVRLWDSATGVEYGLLQDHTDVVTAVAFSPDGQIIASSSADYTIRLWDLAMPVGHRIFQGHTDWVRAVAFSPDGRILASASFDHTVRLWDLATGAESRILQGHWHWVRAVAFSQDGQTVVSASADNTLRLWDPVTGIERYSLQGHTDSVNAVAFSPDGKTVISSSADCTVRLWDRPSGMERHILHGHMDPVVAVAFSPDGQIVASAADTIRLWDLSNWIEQHTSKAYAYPVTALSVSLDGKIVASGSANGAVHLWDSATDLEYRPLQGHTDSITELAFSVDGQTLASASIDGTVRLWDPATGARKDKHQPDVGMNKVTFPADDWINTNPSSLSPKPQSSRSFMDRQGNDIHVGEKWITRNGQRLIWLPPEYRASCAVASGNSVILGHKSGRLTFLWLK